MTTISREEWLRSLSVADAVLQRKITMTMSEKRIEAINDDGSFIVGERLFEKDGHARGVIGVNYDILPLTPDMAAELQLRDSVSYLASVKWSTYPREVIEAIIEMLRTRAKNGQG